MPNEIYKFLKENNLTTKSEADFEKEYSNREKANELHNFMVQNNLTQKTSDDFYTAYFKKKVQTSAPVGVAGAALSAAAQKPVGEKPAQTSPPQPPTSQQGVPSTSRLTSVSGVGDKKPDNFWSFAKTLSENKDKEFVQRMMQPDVSIKNADGTVSTHKMATANVDGKEIAFPTIVNQNGKLVDYSKDINKAIDFALKNNEYISFDDPNKAKEFAEGAWKKVIKGYTEKLQKPTIQKPAAKKEETTFVGDLIESVGRGSARLGQMIAETPAFVYDVFAWPQNKLAEITGLPLQASSEEFARTVGLPENEISKYYENQVRLSQEKINQKYDKGITEYFKNGEYSKGLKLLSNQIAESAPITISLAMGNAAGMTTLQSILGGGTVFAAGKKAELDQMPNAAGMSETAKIENAMMTGLFEGVFEQMGITKLGGAVMNMIKGKTAEEAADIAKKSFMEVYGPVLRKYFGTSVEEGLSETGTTFATNVVDKFTGADPNKNLSEGLSDSFLVGLGSGKLFGAGPTLYEISSNRAIRSEAQKIQKQKEQIANALSDPNITKETREVLNESLKEVNLKEAESFSAEKEKIEQLPVDLKQQHDDVVKNINTIEVAMGDPNILQETVSILENKLKEEYKKAENILAKAERIKAETPVVPEVVTPIEAVAPTEAAPEEAAPKAEVIPIRQLGTGANVYFETEKHRVNDFGDKVLLNIGESSSNLPATNIEFDNASDAVKIAERVAKDYPNGVPPALLVDKYIDNLKQELLVAPKAETITTPATEVITQAAPSVLSPEAGSVVGRDVDLGGGIKNKVTDEKVRILPIAEIDNLRSQKQTDLATGNAVSLEKDLTKNGIKEPLVITYYPNEGKAVLTDGHNRLDVAKDMGAEKLPIRIVEKYTDAPTNAKDWTPPKAIEQSLKVTPEAAPSVPSPEAQQTAEVNRQAVSVFEEISPLLDSRKGADVKSKRDINKAIMEKVKSNPKADFIYTNWNKLKKQLKFEHEGNCP